MLWGRRDKSLACAGGSWGGEASIPVVFSELQEQEKSLPAGFFVTASFFQHGVVPTGSISLTVPAVTEVCKGPYRGTADGGEGGERKRGHRKGEACHSEGFVKPLKVSLWLCWMQFSLRALESSRLYFQVRYCCANASLACIPSADESVWVWILPA